MANEGCPTDWGSLSYATVESALGDREPEGDVMSTEFPMPSGKEEEEASNDVSIVVVARDGE